jgi:hypothetical protein
MQRSEAFVYLLCFAINFKGKETSQKSSLFRRKERYLVGALKEGVEVAVGGLGGLGKHETVSDTLLRRAIDRFRIPRMGKRSAFKRSSQSI